jgi:hypothetical protein
VSDGSEVVVVWYGAPHGDATVREAFAARMMPLANVQYLQGTRVRVALVPWTSTAYGLELRP